MVIRAIILTVVLASIWVILTENFTWQNILISLAVGGFVTVFSNKFLPEAPQQKTHIKLHKLITYPFWLIGKMYKDAFGLIKLIFTGAKCGLVKEKLELENEALRIVVASSVTLTPGTITMEQANDEIVVLCIDEEKAYPEFTESVKGMYKMQRRLKKAEVTKQESK